MRRAGEPSGFMREIDGRTVGVSDLRHKSRRDIIIEDPTLIKEPAGTDQPPRDSRDFAKVHQFHVTRMERYIVSCYDAAEAGHFHRASRQIPPRAPRIAALRCRFNLNDDFEGGEGELSRIRAARVQRRRWGARWCSPLLAFAQGLKGHGRTALRVLAVSLRQCGGQDARRQPREAGRKTPSSAGRTPADAGRSARAHWRRGRKQCASPVTFPPFSRQGEI